MKMTIKRMKRSDTVILGQLPQSNCFVDFLASEGGNYKGDVRTVKAPYASIFFHPWLGAGFSER